MKRLTGLMFFFTFGIIFIGIVGTVTTKLVFNEPSYHYSEGDRIGVLRKFSKKGLIWKTYEGELMLNANMGSVKLDTFYFSVVNKEIADSLAANIGKEIKLHYNQYLIVPYKIGSTSYIVDKIEIIENASN